MKCNVYLNFNGNCREAVEFYGRVLGGHIVVMQTHAEAGLADQVPAHWRDTIMHARLIAGDAVIMASDSPPEHYQPPQGIYAALQVDTPADADRIFAALSEGGEVAMPIQETFWAARFGMCTDRFGTPWMVNCDAKA